MNNQQQETADRFWECLEQNKVMIPKLQIPHRALLNQSSKHENSGTTAYLPSHGGPLKMTSENQRSSQKTRRNFSEASEIHSSGVRIFQQNSY